MRKGFTLIEIVIYIALLGVLLTGIIVSTYPIFTGAEHSSSGITRDGEIAFVLQKISWALGSETSVSVPGTHDTLNINTASGSFSFTQQNGSVALDGSPLTTSRVTVSNFDVRDVGGTPHLIVINFDISSPNATSAHVGPVKYYVHF
jgi:prepilin-type N-terminal cleavage/methylation domain-containing protein